MTESAIASTPRHELVRAIGRWSLVALVVNSIIGSGVFGLPSAVAALIGNYSPYAVLAAGAGMSVIIGCFAEVASRFQQAGGPYLYARVAFGRLMGIQTAWMLWLGQVAAPAANANLFVIYLGEFFPHAKDPLPRAHYSHRAGRLSDLHQHSRRARRNPGQQPVHRGETGTAVRRDRSRSARAS